MVTLRGFDLSEVIDALATFMTKRGKTAFLQGVSEALKGGDIIELVEAIEAGDPTPALTMDTSMRLGDLQDVFVATFQQAGISEANALDTVREFQTNNPRALRAAQNHIGELIQGIQDETRRAVQQTISNGLRDGSTTRDIAQRIKSIPGISERDSSVLENFRRGLKDQGLPSGDRDRLFAEYADRLRDAEALRIARTEITRAIEMGRQEWWLQLADAGLIKRSEVTRIWRIKDDDACEVCHDLNGRKARLGGKFKNKYDSPPAHPNCRCKVELETTFADLSMLQKHYGPGDHKSGSSQDAHGGDDDGGFSERLGECYPCAGRKVMDDGGTLIHGVIRSGHGSVAHAWVEQDDGSIFEPVTEVEYDEIVFRLMMRPYELARYTPEELRLNTIRTGHWGPWDEASELWANTYHAAEGDHITRSNFANEAVMSADDIQKHYGPGPHRTGTTQQEAHGQGISGEERRLGISRDLNEWMREQDTGHATLDAARRRMRDRRDAANAAQSQVDAARRRLGMDVEELHGVEVAEGITVEAEVVMPEDFDYEKEGEGFDPEKEGRIYAGSFADIVNRESRTGELFIAADMNEEMWEETIFGDPIKGLDVNTYFSDPRWQGEASKVRGTFFDEDGKEVGRFTFSFLPEYMSDGVTPTGRLDMYGEMMEFDPEFQGTGIAEEIFQRVGSYAWASGDFATIHLNANMTVGGYAWAKAGLDWDVSSYAGDSSKGDLRDRFTNMHNWLDSYEDGHTDNMDEGWENMERWFTSQVQQYEPSMDVAREVASALTKQAFTSVEVIDQLNAAAPMPMTPDYGSYGDLANMGEDWGSPIELASIGSGHRVDIGYGWTLGKALMIGSNWYGRLTFPAR